jgi:hypothetical protein
MFHVLPLMTPRLDDVARPTIRSDSNVSRYRPPTTERLAQTSRPGSRQRTLAIVIALGFVFAACGGSTSSSSSGASASADTATVTDQAAAGADTGSERNPGDAYGEYGVYERVNFPAGSSGTTVSAGVVRGTVNGYLFAASAGQVMTVEIVSENAVFDLYAPDDSALTGGRYALVDPLPANGDYLIVVQSEFGNASFELIVEINTPDPQDGAAEASACPAGYTEFDNQYPLRICHKGEIVEVLQALLVDLGYDLDVDGFFGEATEAALAEEFDDVGEITVPADMEALRTCDDDC